jgi:hypothetical protein
MIIYLLSHQQKILVRNNITLKYFLTLLKFFFYILQMSLAVNLVQSRRVSPSSLCAYVNSVSNIHILVVVEPVLLARRFIEYLPTLPQVYCSVVRRTGQSA